MKTYLFVNKDFNLLVYFSLTLWKCAKNDDTRVETLSKYFVELIISTCSVREWIEPVLCPVIGNFECKEHVVL